MRIRVERWIEKLACHIDNPTWRNERNLYVQALYRSVLRNDFKEPFHTMPPDGGLPALPATVRSEVSVQHSTEARNFWRNM